MWWLLGFVGAAFVALIAWGIVSAASDNNVGQKHDD